MKLNAALRKLDLQEFVLLGTLMVVGLRVAVGLVEETPQLSVFCTGLIWMASGQDSWVLMTHLMAAHEKYVV